MRGDEHQRKYGLDHIDVSLKRWKSWVPSVGFLNLWLQRVYTPRGNGKLIPSTTRIDLTLVLTSKYFLKIGYWLNGLVIAFSGFLWAVLTWEVRHLEWGCQAVRVKGRMSKSFSCMKVLPGSLQLTKSQISSYFSLVNNKADHICLRLENVPQL